MEDFTDFHSDFSLSLLLTNDFSLFSTTTFADMQILWFSVAIINNLT